MKWVITLAKKYVRGGYSDERLMDAIQSGSLGMVRAIEKFDPTKGYKLSTYSYFWIIQCIQRGEETRDAIRIPDLAYQQYRKLEKAVAALRVEGRIVTTALLSEMTGIPAATVSQRLEIGKIKIISSLDKVASHADGDGTALIDLIADESISNDWEDSAHLDSQRAWLDAHMTELTEAQRSVIQGIREGQTHTALAEQMGISRSRTGQLRGSAVKRLRAAALAA
jgi:RNA polymerase sigma factor (sigma-70 family)